MLLARLFNYLRTSKIQLIVLESEQKVHFGQTFLFKDLFFKASQNILGKIIQSPKNNGIKLKLRF